MRKRLLPVVIISGLLFTMTACGNYDIADENMPAQKTDSVLLYKEGI